MKIVIAGSRGFIGSHLVTFFKERGDDLVLLSRNPDSPETIFWDPHIKQIDASHLEGADVVINLSGESILGRWTQKKMEQIRTSRLESSQFLCETLFGLKTLPKLYLAASAIGYYGDRKGEVLTESSQSGHGYLADVCRDWEQIPTVLSEKGVRVALCRFGVILGPHGGAFKYMEKAFRMGMGGVLGSGEQMMSWMAIEDVCGAIAHLIEHEELSGPVNFVSPNPLTNLEFTKILGRILNRPTVVPVPKFALSLLFGSGAEIFLDSKQVEPKVLMDSGYQFRYPNLDDALKSYTEG